MPVAFPLMIGAIGLILVGTSLVSFWKAKATKHWRTTSGQVLSVQIVPIEQTREKQHVVVFYKPEVTYSYNVGGKQYVSDKIRADLQGHSRTTEAERFLAAHPVGSSVVVYYDPVNPADALLEPDRNPQAKSLLATGIILAIVAATMLVVRIPRKVLWPHAQTGNGSP